MTNTVSRLKYLVLLILFISLISCNKETTINGLILDKKTGLPIKDAYVTISIYTGNYQTTSFDTYSDINGRFSYTNEDWPIQIYDVQRTGYIPKGSGSDLPPIKKGKENNVSIELTPNDGILKLGMLNNTGLHDSIYLGIYSPIQQAEYFISHGIIDRESFKISNQSSTEKVLNLASGETIGIYWGFSPIPFDIKLAPFHDSIFVAQNDTTRFNISF